MTNNENRKITADLLPKQLLCVLSLLVLMISFQNCGTQFMGETDQSTLVSGQSQPQCKTGVNSEEQGPMVKRLTSNQYKNSIISIFGNIFDESDFPKFGDAIPTIGLSNNPAQLQINPINFENIFNSSEKITEKIILSNSDFVNCASGDSCIVNLYKKYGFMLLRRPITDEDLNSLTSRISVLKADGANHKQIVKALFRATLSSAEFLFRTELGETTSTGERKSLTDFELASWLSFTLWDSGPDQELLDLASKGLLSDEAVLDKQFARLTSDVRYIDTMADFYVDLLKINQIYDKEKSNELGIPFTDSFKKSLVASAEASIKDALKDPEADLLSVFKDLQFYGNESLNPVFNTSLTGDELQPISVDPKQRYGILTHPAFLSVHSGHRSSGIVKRGVYTLEQLLCNHLPAPPDAVSAVEELPEGFDPTKVSSRVVFEVSHSTQSQCAGCHRIIDPAGFGFENFDSLGRFRTTEKENIPIDASGDIVLSDGEHLQFSDSLSYVKTLSTNSHFKKCISNHYYSYTMGTQAKAGNSCNLEFDAVVDFRKTATNLTNKQLSKNLLHLMKQKIQRQPGSTTKTRKGAKDVNI